MLVGVVIIIKRLCQRLSNAFFFGEFSCVVRAEILACGLWDFGFSQFAVCGPHPTPVFTRLQGPGTPLLGCQIMSLFLGSTV